MLPMTYTLKKSKQVTEVVTKLLLNKCLRTASLYKKMLLQNWLTVNLKSKQKIESKID